MTFALLGLMLLASEPLPEVTDAPDPSPPLWEIYAGLQGGLRLSERGPGGGAMLGVNRKFLGFLRPELMLASNVYSAPVDVLVLIRIGARLELPLASPWKPYLWLAFAHNHESGIDAVKQDPLPHIFGLSEAGVHHRSGFDAGLGIAYEIPRQGKGRLAGRLGARVTFTQFLGDSYPPRYLDLTFTAGVCL